MTLYGVIGWKNSGKTGLVERLVAEFTARGLRVSTVKHAHHSVDLDQPGKDSHRHREAGAQEVMLVTNSRVAVLTELRGAPEPPLADLLQRLAPADLVLIEGYKRDAHPKIEAHRAATGQPLIAPGDPTVRAVASDAAPALDRPVFDLDDTAAIADFIARDLGLEVEFDTGTAAPTGGTTASAPVFAVGAAKDAPFRRFVMADWSGGNDRGARPCKDAIWLGETGAAPQYQRNRTVAEAAIAERIEAALVANERLLLGFDFPFAYPAGFGRALTGQDDPLAVWDWFAARVEDAPKANNRFDVAAGINRALGSGRGPFWANALGRDIDGLARTKRDYANPFPEKRACEAHAKGSFTCWQLAGAGAVGSQVIMGLPVLHRLRARFPGQIAVWPFEPLDKPVALIEIWPGLIEPAVKAATPKGAIRDAVQVDLLARALARQGPAQMAALLDVRAPVEGWILGLGHEDALTAAASDGP